MARLRDPAGGCPWDLQQSFATIAPYTVEEAYEVADAIERADLVDLRGELGDLLFQVVFHARMAEEAGAFTFGDVVQGIVDKMIRRHPHVFAADGDGASPDAAAVTRAWEEHKAAERAARAADEGGETSPGLLDDVPRSLPALKRALKLTRRAATVGFDWPRLDQVRDKLAEELAEFDAELRALPPATSKTPTALGEADRARVTDELGDVLFVMANLARHIGIDPETALQRANAKFTRRFGYIESTLAARGEALEEAGLDAMDALWNEAKERLG